MQRGDVTLASLVRHTSSLDNQLFEEFYGGLDTAILRKGGAQSRRACSHRGHIHRCQRCCQRGGTERLKVQRGGPSAKRRYPPAPEGLVTKERDDLCG